MLENIAIIASIICGVTSITTSLRAVGVSREFQHAEHDAVLRTACRVGDMKDTHARPQRSSLKLHLLVTVVWYVLAVLCIVPVISGKIGNETTAALMLWTGPFAVCALINFVVWKWLVKTL